MKLQTQATRSRLYRAGAVALTYLFLLLLSRGFVISSDDWFFTSRTQDEGLLQALKNGWANAWGHYQGTNGRLLGNGVSKALGCSEFWREIVRCGIILTILLQLVRTARIKGPMLYMTALALTVALPADIYAQSYAWAAGFFNYVPPLMMILAYIHRAERVLAGERDTALWGLAMVPLALSCQFFVENVTAGMCLFSAGVLLWHLVRSRRLSWSLTGFFLGAAAGCIVMFSAPGYANVNTEGYREVSATFEELMEVIKTNLATITSYLTERNWLVIAPLTVLSICLLLGAEPKKKSIVRLRSAALACLCACPVWFFANRQLVPVLGYVDRVTETAFWLDILFNLLYLLSVLAAALLGLRDKTRMGRAVLCIAAVPMVFGPLVVVTPIGARCLYIPYMLLVGILLIFAAELAERYPADRKRLLAVPMALVTCFALSVYLWTALWNGNCEKVRIETIESAMEAGETGVVLPSFPYGSYVHMGNGYAIRYYYYYEEPGDLEFRYILHEDWYRSQ